MNSEGKSKYLPDGKYLISLSGSTGGVAKPNDIYIDNTPPVLNLDEGRTSVEFDGTVTLVDNIEDPVMNDFVNSKVDKYSIPPFLIAGDGTTINLNYDDSTGTLTASIPPGFSIASLSSPEDISAAKAALTAKLVALGNSTNSARGTPPADKVGNRISCYLKKNK